MLEERILKSEDDTIEFAKELAPKLKKGDVVALYGELGAGKTFFTQHLCKFLGVTENVSSPSYVLMNEYMGNYIIRHLDLYRLDAAEEVLELGLYDLYEDAITIIEWPEIANGMLPENTIHIHFEFDGSDRKVTIKK
ncbi:MAG: tRNA (adenosine(37)-N6)-threonylcarbamoyltransferase complex ATPase subunit type 1 TsaE [Candidatus Cloacimonadota bacterium]|nr:tRNA (adenosine(37)-N6)-threonylcarbamoyltransferase complex ATPase subunit type 1 TsaE [Candidatus Cloacimonadota bacterium]